MTGITATLEVFDVVQQVADAVTAAKEDGSIDWKDIPKFAPVVFAAKKLVEDGKMIPGELSELDQQEVAELVNKAFAALSALVQAVVK